MRIRNYRQSDIPTIAHIQQMAAATDGTEPISMTDFETWLTQPELEAQHNAFVVTDDDESNEWGQAGTLEGIEGEVIGYAILQLRRNQHSYHFLCEGAVLPQHRRRGAGTALLICALNRAQVWSTELGMGEDEYPFYFEALLPLKDQASENLARRCELQSTDERTLIGMRLYRRVL